RIAHPIYGEGIVTFVGTEYIGIGFDGGGEILFRREALEREVAAPPEPVAPPRETLPWPDSTFVPEGDETRHFPGSHWEPFAANATQIMARLPEIAPNAHLPPAYETGRQPPRPMPGDWTKGFQLVWPEPTQGLALVLRPEPEANMIVSLFPFITAGSRHTLTLRQVNVWAGGLEAQVTVDWGGGDVSFFDTGYVIHRAWYEAGRDYDFALSGIAYRAGPAEQREWHFNRHPDEVAWMNRNLKDGEEPFEADGVLRMDGAAVFLPVKGGDVDDYSFRAPVKSVEAFQDWLGQDGWRVRATVIRFGDEDADLDIMITRRAWSGEAPPRVGEDIEGQLWLQGCLLIPRE
ncbi:MAG: hypothetical protein JNK22_10820, partial [Rhodocyclaceae bacterium]|nr:hypothetical protein [Rhodocyclaceae bacterium]